MVKKTTLPHRFSEEMKKPQSTRLGGNNRCWAQVPEESGLCWGLYFVFEMETVFLAALVKVVEVSSNLSLTLFIPLNLVCVFVCVHTRVHNT